MRHDCLGIGLGKAGKREAVCHKARDHGREHDVGGAERAEQIWPILAKARSRLCPVLQYADSIGAGFFGQCYVGEGLARVHRAFAA